MGTQSRFPVLRPTTAVARRAVVVAGLAVAPWLVLPRRSEPYFQHDVPPPDARPVNPGPIDLPVPAGVDSFVNGVGMRMIRVPAGRFTIGSPGQEAGRHPDEPRNDVVLPQDFWISQTEVTQAQWRAIIEFNPSRWKQDRLPVHGVTYGQAELFCGRLGRLEGMTYRLPTQVEWEIACRAGSQAAYATGETLPEDRARFARDAEVGEDGGPGPRPVGSHPANAWGIHDMHGNVAEWARYPYVPRHQGEADTEDVPFLRRFAHCPLRGGGWSSTAVDCRSARRDHAFTLLVDDAVGFRVVAERRPRTP